jgi:hypothetical protein
MVLEVAVSETSQMNWKTIFRGRGWILAYVIPVRRKNILQEDMELQFYFNNFLPHKTMQRIFHQNLWYFDHTTRFANSAGSNSWTIVNPLHLYSFV